RRAIRRDCDVFAHKCRRGDLTPPRECRRRGLGRFGPPYSPRAELGGHQMSDEIIYRIVTSRAPVVTGAQPAAPEWDDLQQRVGGIENTPHLLSTLEDVNTTGDAGTVLVKQADGTWKTGSVADPLM